MSQYYLDRALEALDFLVAGLHEDDTTRMTMRAMQEEFATAQRWRITPEALKMVWNTDLSEDVVGESRPPSRIIAIEYDFDFSELSLTFDPKDDSFSECRPRVTILIDDDVTSEGGILLYNFFKHPHAATWSVVPYATRLTRKEMQNITTYLPPASGKKKELTLPIVPLVPHVSFAEMARRMHTTPEAFIKRLSYHAPIADDVRVAVGLMQLLSCENAPVRRDPAPVKLNAKRKKSGKTQIPEYRTLHLTRDITEAQGYPSESAVKEMRKSPRRHLRRGHIHRWRLKTGDYRKKWLPPTIICAWNDEEIMRPVKVVP